LNVATHRLRADSAALCNGRRLNRGDSALVRWPPVSIFRSLLLIANRRGNLADAVEGTR
jgi:hypothetical protein